ncbi:MAG: hypothetical protein [Bacteriophage sp.]|nr:MAG: hypothetical protein [Bacteriophage sp.]
MREKRYDKDMKGTGREEREGERGNKGSFCRSWSRIEGNGKRELYSGF